MVSASLTRFLALSALCSSLAEEPQELFDEDASLSLIQLRATRSHEFVGMHSSEFSTANCDCPYSLCACQRAAEKDGKSFGFTHPTGTITAGRYPSPAQMATHAGEGDWKGIGCYSIQPAFSARVFAAGARRLNLEPERLYPIINSYVYGVMDDGSHPTSQEDLDLPSGFNPAVHLRVSGTFGAPACNPEEPATQPNPDDTALEDEIEHEDQDQAAAVGDPHLTHAYGSHADMYCEDGHCDSIAPVL